MEAQKLTLAEWMYLDGPFTSRPYKLIGFTVLELLFLGALKIQTKKAHYHGPRDPKVRGLMQYVSLGTNADKFFFAPHQELIINLFKKYPPLGLSQFFNFLKQKLGTEGKRFLSVYLKPKMKRRGILTHKSSLLNSVNQLIGNGGHAVSTIKDQLDELKRAGHQLPLGYWGIKKYGALVLWKNYDIPRELWGSKIEMGKNLSSSFYNFELKEPYKYESIELYFPPFSLRDFLNISKRHFEPEENGRRGGWGHFSIEILFNIFS